MISLIHILVFDL